MKPSRVWPKHEGDLARLRRKRMEGIHTEVAPTDMYVLYSDSATRPVA